VREEKDRLKAEKARRQEEFLKSASAKREQLEAQADARRLALKHEQSALQASKELEINDRRWRLEQECRHRADVLEARRAAARAEATKKQREREDALSAAQRKRQELEESRRKQELLESEELENRRVLEEAAKLEKQRAAHSKENEQRGAKQVRLRWACCCLVLRL
jgi:hypothetical protein